MVVTEIRFRPPGISLEAVNYYRRAHRIAREPPHVISFCPVHGLPGGLLVERGGLGLHTD